jgi:hypothetical protein
MAGYLALATLGFLIFPSVGQFFLFSPENP